MASYRPFPPHSFPPPPPQNQNPLPPQQQHYGQNYNQMNPNSNYHYPPSRPPQQQQHPPPPEQQYSYPPPPPPPPDSSYPPPPPPSLPTMPQNTINSQPPMYYPPSQYSSQYGNQAIQSLQPPPPPPPPSSPGSSIPPPPPPSSPPPPPPKESIGDKGLSERSQGGNRDFSGSGRREHGHSNHGVGGRELKPLVLPVKKPNGPAGRVETEEERRLRKKMEFEKQRQEEKHRQQMESQKTQMMSSGKGHGSMVGSRMGDKRATPFLSGERIENRLKKPTTFLCKLKFRNELPDPSAQPKLMALKKDKDRFTKYTITSLEKMYKPKLFIEPDLGIPLDLLDLSVYNPPSVRPPLAPEDEELLRNEEAVTPIKKDGIRRKERPTDKGVSWLVKTQYISPLSMESTKQSLTEKQAKELRELKGGRNLLEVNRERQIKEIERSFEASKLRPVHATNKNLEPIEVMPLLPDFVRYDDQFVMVAFDGAPTADSDIFSKLHDSVRDEHESRAIMKSYLAPSSDSANPEKFLAYMVPSLDELSKDMYDEHEDISYSWVREYHWDVCNLIFVLLHSKLELAL
ncbi:hypothetical protein CRYUN_Cryun32bG0088700 [Craigia yunnanensis]